MLAFLPFAFRVECEGNYVNTGRQARLRLNATFDDKREMTKPPYDAFSVLDTAMQIIEDEHHYFVNRRVENQDHIPRIVRIAESAGKILKSSGMPKVGGVFGLTPLGRYERF